MKKLKIIILTRLPNGYVEKRFADVALERGHTVEIVKFTNVSIFIDSDKNDSVIYNDKSLSGVDVVIPRLYGGPGDYGVSILRQLELIGIYTPNKSIAISRANQSVRAIQIMRSKGIQLPKTIIARGTDKLADHLEELQIPFLLQRASDRSASQMIIDSKKTANSMLSVMSSVNEIFIAQEFDKFAQENVYKALIIGKSVVASIKYNRVSAIPNKAKPYPFTVEQLKIANKAIKSIGLAICEINIIDGKKGPEVVSINANPDFEFYEKSTSRDLATKVIEYVEINAKQRNKKDKIGA